MFPTGAYWQELKAKMLTLNNRGELYYLTPKPSKISVKTHWENVQGLVRNQTIIDTEGKVAMGSTPKKIFWYECVYHYNTWN